MRHFLSSYANWFSHRHRRFGHRLQGRFNAEPVEDESFYWEVSRDVHLNPLRTRRPPVAHPKDWPWSSYPGYQDVRQRVAWVRLTNGTAQACMPAAISLPPSRSGRSWPCGLDV